MSCNYFFDPENLIDKCEIINNKIIEKSQKSEPNKFENDAIIEIDSDTNSTTFQSEFEKVVGKSELTLEVLKEVPHDDKENISSTFNEFGKRPRGRPKEHKPKTARVRKEKSHSPEPSTAPKTTFNISLGFLNCKNKTSRAKSKKSHNSIQTDINTSNTINLKKRGRPKQKSSLEIVSTTIANNLTDKTDNLSVMNVCTENSDIDTTKINENDINIGPVKRKRGRPFGTLKVKDKKYPGQKGRPLSNNICIIAPKRRRGRPFSVNKPIINKNKHGRPGRPSLGLTKLKKYDRPGRPRGPPKPIKIPGKRGRKPNPHTPPKQIKIPGRGRGRPSFASLKELKENETKNKIDSDAEQNVSNSCNSNTIKNDSESESESENELNIVEKSDETENSVKINSTDNNSKGVENDILLVNNLPIMKVKTHIEDIRNVNEIETISLTSSDSDSEYDNNKELLNNDVEGFFTITDNKFKIEAELDYMFHGAKNIVQKRYI